VTGWACEHRLKEKALTGAIEKYPKGGTRAKSRGGRTGVKKRNLKTDMESKKGL